MNNKLHLGLDWDGTISCYTTELQRLAQQASQISIITVNDEITLTLANQTLGIEQDKISVLICPDERLDDYPIWKAETCLIRNVSLMIDDEYPVVQACWQNGVPALWVRERHFSETKDFLEKYTPHQNSEPD